MNERIVRTYVNRKREDGNNVILISDTGTGLCKHHIIRENISARECMLYLLAEDIRELELKISQNIGLDKSYTFIVNKTLKGITKEQNRIHYLTNRTTLSKVNPVPLSLDFLSNIGFIHSALIRLKDKNINIRLITDDFAIPHEYNGKKYGSKEYAEIITKTWEALDKIVPPKDRSIPDFKIESV